VSIVSVNYTYTLTPEQKQQIIASLQAKQASRPCSRCGNSNFSLMDFVFLAPLHSSAPRHIVAAPQSVPTVAVACTNCGALYHHLLGVLVPLEEYGFGK
jgi:hypothetical protein